MARILVVDDEDFFRKAICEYLKNKRFDVCEASSVKEAKEFLTRLDLQLVITDIQMPELTGIDLLEWAQTHKTPPFIVMTGFSTLLETHSAYDLGAKEFITKPFRHTDLMHAIERVLGSKHGITLPMPPATEYCKISIEDVAPYSTIDFDVFVKLSENKYIKIAHKGESVPRERMGQYKEKGVHFLYVAKADLAKLGLEISGH
ncbi:MAG: response regulator [Bdellovibrionales bacterium]